MIAIWERDQFGYPVCIDDLDFGDAEVKVEGLLRQPEGREPIPVKKEEK